MLAIGTQVGKYVIDAPLGQGGMAAVYRAHHVRLGSVHAVKVLLPEIAREPELRLRFLNEGRIQAQLRHPNLVAVTDLLEEGDFVGLVMDFVEGEGFDAHLRGAGPADLSVVRDVFAQVLSALDYVHERGVVHRDLKPSNILVGHEGGHLRARVADFGIAKFDPPGGQALTQAGTTLGTLYFMSPEQVRGESVTRASDIFSMGVILYRCVTGRLPFDGDSQWKVQTAIVNAEYPAPESVRPDVPPALAHVVRKALGREPSQRFATCAEFARALEHALAGGAPPPEKETTPAIPARMAMPAPAPKSEPISTPKSAPQIPPEPIDEGPAPEELAFGATRRRRTAIASALLVLAAGGAAIHFKPWNRGTQPTLPADLDAVIREAVRVEPKSGLELVRLPAGAFQVGCMDSDPECWADEKPSKPAKVEGFWFGRTEVTVAAWAKCAAAKACSTAPKLVANSEGEGCNWGAQKNTHPVNCVTWDEANAFCEWLGGRLPTGAEWEYAAKTGGRHRFPWGDDAPSEAHARFATEAKTADVASHPRGATPWGLQDLAGNVWEWTLDDFRSKKKEARGGSWKSKARWLRASNRFGVEPDTRSDTIGFRCVVEETPEG